MARKRKELQTAHSQYLVKPRTGICSNASRKRRHFREYERSPERLEELKKQYEDMLDRMDQLVERGEMSAYEQLTIIDMSKRVLNSIARKYDKIREGVHIIMGGKVLDHPAKRIYNEGMEQERINNVRIIMQKMKMTAQQAMDFLIFQFLSNHVTITCWIETRDVLGVFPNGFTV